VDGVVSRERAEQGQIREHLRHAVSVAEARGGVTVDLDEARTIGSEERIQPREQHVRRSGIEADPARLRLRRAQVGAERADVAVEDVARDPGRDLHQPAARRPQRVPLSAPDEVGAQARSHGFAVERDARALEGLLQPLRLLARRPRIGRDQSVELGGGIGHVGAATGRAPRPRVRPRW